MVNSHYVPQLILRHFADDEIEKELCRKTEVQFANVLNNKILKERYRLILTKDELFILKKYLVITTVRYNITEAMKDFDNPKNMVASYSDIFFKTSTRC